MTALVGYKGQVLVTSSPSVSASNLALTDAGDHATFNASTSATQRYWDKTQAANFVVQTSTNGGTSWSIASATLYTISRYVNGQVLFAPALAVGTTARMQTYYYFAYSVLVDAHSWELSLDASLIDVTTFNTAGWKTYLPVPKSANGKIDRFWIDGAFQAIMGNLMVIILYIDSTALNRYEMYGYI